LNWNNLWYTYPKTRYSLYQNCTLIIGFFFFFHFLIRIQQLAITWSLVKQIGTSALPKIKLYVQAFFEGSENFQNNIFIVTRKMLQLQSMYDLKVNFKSAYHLSKPPFLYPKEVTKHLGECLELFYLCFVLCFIADPHSSRCWLYK